MKIAALLTGRGGSKLKDKNIIKLAGLPCLAYPCKAAKKVKIIDKYFVSSENKKILKEASKYKFEIIKRPFNLARASTLHVDVLKHALRVMNKKFSFYPEILIVLLANAPIVKAKWIKNSINLLIKNKEITSVVPVIKNNDHHPIRSVKIKGNYLESNIKLKDNISTNRQDLNDNYFLCHNFWAIKTSNIFKNKRSLFLKFLGNKVKAYPIENSIDIHSQEDVLLANFLIKKNK